MSIFRKKSATATISAPTKHAEPVHHEREHTMTIDTTLAPAGAALDAATEADLQQKAKDHLWMHFARQSGMEAGNGVPIIVRGEGHHVYDSHGKKYIDGLSGLFVVQVGHGRERLAEAARKQAEELAYFPLWSYAHPTAIELADRLADWRAKCIQRWSFAFCCSSTSRASPIAPGSGPLAAIACASCTWWCSVVSVFLPETVRALPFTSTEMSCGAKPATAMVRT